MNTSERLRFARVRSGATQRGLGALAGLASAHVGLIESGVVENPETKTWFALATALGVSFAWLSIGAGPMLPEHPELDADNPEHHRLIEAALRGGSKASESRPSHPAAA